MNKNVILLIAFCFCLSFVPLGYAQVLNVDAPETVSDSSNLIGKVTDHVKEAQKYIENSQLAKAVGDGVKYAKKGMAYAEKKHAELMSKYNQLIEKKDELVNSPEVKITQKTTEIGVLEKKLKDLEKQQKQAQQETDDKISLVQAEAEAKIKNLNKNLANAQIMMADGDNEQARVMAKDINNEIAQIRQNAADKVSALQRDLRQKTGIVPQQDNAVDVNENEVREKSGEQNTEEALDWEISNQNQDNLVASLKPGVQITDTLQDSPEILQELPQAQMVKKTINNDLKTKENKAIEKITTNRKLRQVDAKQPALLKQVQPAKRVSDMQKTMAVERVRE